MESRIEIREGRIQAFAVSRYDGAGGTSYDSSLTFRLPSSALLAQVLFTPSRNLHAFDTARPASAFRPWPACGKGTQAGDRGCEVWSGKTRKQADREIGVHPYGRLKYALVPCGVYPFQALSRAVVEMRLW